MQDSRWQSHSSKSHTACLAGLDIANQILTPEYFLKHHCIRKAWMSAGMTFIIPHLHDIVNTN